MTDRRHVLEGFKGLRIAVLGDPMIDYYHFGRIDRFSPEAPGRPIFVEESMELRDGGAARLRVFVFTKGERL